MMTFFFPLSFVLGFKFIRSNTRKKIISLVSILSTFGIALSVSILIIGLSAINGFERELNNRVLSIIPHGDISMVNAMMYNWEKKLLYIQKIANVSGASPYINSTGFLDKSKKIKIIQIRGLDVKLEKNVSDLYKFIQKTSWINFCSGTQKVIIGASLSKEFDIHVGDWIPLTISHKISDKNFLKLKKIHLKVIDIFKINGILDKNLVLVPLKDLQKYLDIGNQIDGISIKFKNPFDIHQPIIFDTEIKKMHLYFKSWMDTYRYMYNDIYMIRAIIYFSMFLIIIIACFNIISILLMIVKEKINDIAILKTIGAKNKLIYGIFIWYSILIALFGIILGLIIAILILSNFEYFIHSIEFFLGHHLLSENIYFIDFVPIELHIYDIFKVLITVFFLILLSNIYPAYRILHINPSDILNKKI